MRIKYPKAIQESEEELVNLEQSLRGQKTADRVRMLRLLKSGTVQSLKDCAPLVGYSVIQLTRWWERYRAIGLAGMLQQHKPTGMASRMTPEAWAGLLLAMRAGRIATMQDARDYLEREWAISYKNGNASGGSSRNTGSSGRLGADDIRKPMENNRQPLKKLREPRKAPTAQACRGFR